MIVKMTVGRRIRYLILSVDQLSIETKERKKICVTSNSPVEVVQFYIEKPLRRAWLDRKNVIGGYSRVLLFSSLGFFKNMSCPCVGSRLKDILSTSLIPIHITSVPPIQLIRLNSYNPNKIEIKKEVAQTLGLST